GIRDFHVTGVQTCALPIWLAPEGRKFVPHVTLARLRGTSAEDLARFLADAAWFEPLSFVPARFVLYSSRDSVGGGPYVVEQAYRSEERRVGKGGGTWM